VSQISRDLPTIIDGGAGDSVAAVAARQVLKLFWLAVESADRMLGDPFAEGPSGAV